jgi:hypothetical protein
MLKERSYEEKEKNNKYLPGNEKENSHFQN